MRAIINLSSDKLAKSAGWRARAIEVSGNDALLCDVLRSAGLRSGTLYDILVKDGLLSGNFVFYVNGVRLAPDSKEDTKVIDGAQIHIMG